MKKLSSLKLSFLTILLVTTANLSFSQTPVSHWSMDGYDTILHGSYEATLMNYDEDDTIFVTGKVGDAVKFDGDTNFIQAVNVPFTSGGEFTICFWMYLDTSGMEMLPSSTTDEVAYYPFSTDTSRTSNSMRFRFLDTHVEGKLDWLRFEIFDKDGTERRVQVRPSKTVATHDDDMFGTKWMHVVGVVYTDSSAVYLDNIHSGSTTSLLNGFEDEGPTWIGALLNTDSTVYGTTFQGMIDEVRLYDVALTPAQIDQVYHATTPVAKINAQKYELKHYPNPFSAQTTISYSLQEAGYVSLEVLDISGKLIEVLVDNEYQQLSTHEKVWNSSKQNPGLYFYRLSIDGKTAGIGKMSVVR